MRVWLMCRCCNVEILGRKGKRKVYRVNGSEYFGMEEVGRRFGLTETALNTRFRHGLCLRRSKDELRNMRAEVADFESRRLAQAFIRAMRPVAA